MRLLLDTHAFIWFLAGDAALSQSAVAAILDEGNETYISAASAWEIATKHRIGRLSGATALAADVAGTVASQGFHELTVTLRHGQLAGALPGPHKDPFDRMLIAQAMSEAMLIVSNETIFDRYPVTRMW
ncbi:MAG TPA: type II toxin-antitoxin system VapC family toxin [Stellaceae bacterium]|nr:type II toxin-antitoxin system VapC family toxin [Stellaceae bacterium]